mmetsp:Transcript_13338/g.32038  ORF Transcript_13338/g.32038 Transcript_13338/m.32038 type:complete len:316 (-) Transcript_13338:415-1362(-)
MCEGTYTPSTISSSGSIGSALKSEAVEAREKCECECAPPPRESESLTWRGPPALGGSGAVPCIIARSPDAFTWRSAALASLRDLCTYSVYASPPPAPPPPPPEPFCLRSLALPSPPAPPVRLNVADRECTVADRDPFLAAAPAPPPMPPCAPKPAAPGACDMPTVPSTRCPKSRSPLPSRRSETPWSRVTEGNPVPVTTHVKGSKLNCEIFTSISSVLVMSLLGVNDTSTAISPLAGTMPLRGCTSNTLDSVESNSSYSNAIGTLQRSEMRLTWRCITPHFPKSIARGNTASFITGYAWMGTSRFSSSLWMRTQS